MGSRISFSLNVSLVISWLHDFSKPQFLFKEVGIIIISSLSEEGLNDIDARQGKFL